MENIDMKTKSSFSTLIFFVIFIAGEAFAYNLFRVSANVEGTVIGVIVFLIALIVSSAIKIADQWEKAVVLRLGRFDSLRGPGLFFIIPVVDSVAYWIDGRVITT